MRRFQLANLCLSTEKILDLYPHLKSSPLERYTASCVNEVTFYSTRGSEKKVNDYNFIPVYNETSFLLFFYTHRKEMKK